jgi:hypothetical protein
MSTPARISHPPSRLAPLRDRVVELARSTPRALPRLRPPRPRVRLGLRPALPGWLLRLLCVALVGVAVLAAGAGGTLTVLGLVLGVGVAVRPGGIWPVAVLGFVAFVLLSAGEGPWRPGAFLALAAGHLFVQLAALLGPYGWSVRVELAVLGVVLRRYLPIQAAAQLTLLLGAVVSSGGLEVPWLAPTAGLTIGAGVLWLAPRMGAPPGRG